MPPLAPPETKQLCYSVLTDAQKHRFEENNELDLSFSVQKLSRFRGNIFIQRGNVSGAFRAIPYTIPTVEELGLPKIISDLGEKPRGLILVTGPTGSGKTTTLYSMLGYVRSEQVNIMTLEDPVEYPMDMIRQTSINEVLRMDFANGIRSLMRQDPDIILVGEIRDPDTAEMAFRSAMTGHQVYSTLHTNSAIGSIPRLMDIGVKSDIMSGNIIGILGQRLVRKLRPNCKAPREAADI